MTPFLKRGMWLGCALAMGLAGCADNIEEPADDVVSWEEFKQSATRVVDGQELYIVEWDLAVTEHELRRRYDAYVESVHPTPDDEVKVKPYSIVNDIGWEDDIWRNEQQMNLTYCVSNAWGANKARVIGEMAQATRAWEQVARVKFNYLPAHDANCSNTNPGVVFSVVPWTGGGACAFFPSGGGCVPRTLVMNLASFPNSSAPNAQSVGVFRHELGHILGLRHEHIHPSSGLVCGGETGSWRPVTGYDRGSVMHYPWCNGVSTSDLSITTADASGVSKLYGGAVTNLAAGRPVLQSSTEFGGDAWKAVDGNIDGNWGGNSVTHSTFQTQPWWRVDLGTPRSVGTVVIGNRTDCCSERLADFDIDVSNDGVNWTIARQVFGAVGARSTHTIGRQARFVRIRLRGTNYLSLAEVEVYPPSNILFSKMVFGGNLWSQTFVFTTPPCSPGGFRNGAVDTFWNSQVGGNCSFLNFVNPADPTDCRANIVATTGGGGFGGQCRAWVRQSIP